MESCQAVLELGLSSFNQTTLTNEAHAQIKVVKTKIEKIFKKFDLEIDDAFIKCSGYHGISSETEVDMVYKDLVSSKNDVQRRIIKEWHELRVEIDTIFKKMSRSMDIEDEK